MSTDPDILEKNVSTLLETGGEAPRMAPAARERIKAHLLATHGTPAATAPRGLWRPRTLALASGVLAAAAVIAVLVGTRGPGPGPEADAPAGDALALADGTTIVRQDGATVAVLGPRHVRVSGAALIDVVPGKGAFVVETARGRIDVLGTRFLVDAEAARTTAAVVRGEVKLSSDTGDVLLHAGEQGVAEPGKVPTRGPAPRLSHLVSWAQAARRKLEHAAPVHHGTLFARQPNVPTAAELPLPLASLAVDVVVEDQVARVALDQTFHNPSPAELEGVYRFAIPPDAALQRLAMYVDGKLTESAVVERMAARRIYEEQVYRRVDPALLEWAGTGRLALRVYPLHAEQDKRLVLAYTQSLPKLYDDWTLSVPLPEVDQPVGELAFHVRVRGCANCELTSPSHAISVTRTGEDAIVSYRQAGARIGDSLVLHVRDTRRAAVVASQRDGDARYLLVRAPAALSAGPVAYRPRTWVILNDVSASRDALARGAQADMIDAFLRELDENDRVAVIAFDVTARVALAPARVQGVDRAAVRKALADEGDVGATDLGGALDAALAQLAGVPADDAMIVYLGDGVITTGVRHLDELRSKLAGKAHFVGVGLGDGPDTQTLAALAAATGGYATTVDLADDVEWRAFDLVAALHTARATGVEARLVDAAGAPVAGTLYGPAQLADGEELELVGKVAAAATPVALELAGTLNGQRWTQRVALPAAAGGEAGYLPRLWAQRHIAARLLAKHEPVTVPPCPPAKGTPCATEVEVRDARDEGIRREVVELGKRYFVLSRHTSLLVLENDAMYAQYGIAKGTGETWAPYALPPTIPAAPAAVVPTATPAHVATDAELVRAPLPVFFAPGNGYGMSGVGEGGGGGIETKSVRDRVDLGFDGGLAGVEQQNVRASSVSLGAGDLVATTTPMANKAADVSDAHVVSGEAFGEKAEPEATRRVRMTLAEGTMGKREAEPDEQQPRANPFASWTPLSVQRYRAPTDPAFDDLTAFVPALFPDAADGWRRELEREPAAGSGALHPIDAAARARLAAARAALPTGVYHWGDREIAVDDARRLGWRQTTDADLAETASYDGTTWTRRYVELGLDATRRVSEDDVALALGYLPVWIAAPDHWARWFTVTARGDHEVVLARGSGVAFVLAFDAASHLVSVHDGGGAELVSVTWAASGPTAARIAGSEIAVGFTGQAIADAPAWAHRDAPASAVVVELPTRVPGYWEGIRAAAAVGGPEWRRATRQHLVSLAAIGAVQQQRADFRELAAHGGVELGDVVLASAGLGVAASAADRAALPASPVARYLQAGSVGTAPVAHGGAGVPSGLVGTLTALRDVTSDLGAGRHEAAAGRVVALGERAPRVRWIAAHVLAAWGSPPQVQERVWGTLATGPYHNQARAAAAYAFLQVGRADDAAQRYAALAADYDLRARPAALGMARYAFQQSRRGAAGWEIAAAQLRDRVLGSESYEHVYALLGSVDAPADRLRVLDRAAALAEGDPERVAELAAAAAQIDQVTWASGLVQPFLAKSPTHDLALLGGRLALRQGRLAEALGDLEQAQSAAGDAPAPIHLVRAEYGELIGTAQRLALESSGPARADAVARALRWGRRWRAIDPGNPQIDMLLGDLMLGVGEPAEAWRQLSTLIERDPMSGSGYEAIANVFEREGKVAEALAYWEEALRIDQTDPTPRLRKAQALFALGRTQDATAALRDITGRRWHERWEWVVETAREQLQEHR